MAPADERRAALGSALFFLLAPGMVAGVVPWWLTRWRVAAPWPWPARAAGALLAAAGALVLLSAFARFARAGRGTPSPTHPTQRLVVSGLYRYVRNPMYLAVTATIVGQGLLLGNTALLAYAALVAAGFVAFVHLYEEPTLRRRYGVEYEAYCARVPRWWPRRGRGVRRP